MIKENYLKRIRNSLNLKQQDITNGQITRNAISHIENLKISLTEKTIALIQDNINDHLLASNHIIKLDYEDLFEENRFQMKIQAESLLNHLEVLVHLKDSEINLTIDELNLILSKWDFPLIKSRTFDLLGEYFYNKFDYRTSLFYFNQTISPIYKIGTLNEIALSVSKLMRAELMANNLGPSLNLSRQLLLQTENLSNENHMRLVFNSALILKKTERYDEALAILKTIEPLLTDKNMTQKIDVLLLKAICYELLGKIASALKVYNILLCSMEDLKDFGSKGNVLANMLSLYIKQNNTSRINETLNKLLMLAPLIDKENTYLPGIYIDIAYCYKHLENNQVAKEYFMHSIKSAILSNEFYDISEALINYIDLYGVPTLMTDHSLTLLILELSASKALPLDDKVIFHYLSSLEKRQEYKELSFFINNITKLQKEI